MGMGNVDVLLWQQRIATEDTAQARFLRWYHPDKFAHEQLARPCAWDTHDSTCEAVHGYVRTEVKPASTVRRDADAKARRERRKISLVDEYNHQPSLYFRPRDHGAVVMSLHDNVCEAVFKLPPDPNKCVPVRVPRPPSRAAASSLGSDLSASQLSQSAPRLRTAPAESSQVSWSFPGLTSGELATVENFFRPEAPRESAAPVRAQSSPGMVRSSSVQRADLRPRRNQDRRYLQVRHELNARRPEYR